MQKELNPHLFGTELTGQGRRMEEAKPFASDRSLKIESKVAELKNQLSDSQEQMARLVSQVNEWSKTFQGRMERLAQAMQKTESQQQSLAQDTAQKISHLHHRVGERKSMDAKIQEMIDRHNSVLRSYEVRLNHLQKLLTEKDEQLLKTVSALNDCKMEITRLKRL